ncbi:developmental pluripotency-associated 5 protein-like [Mirounga leonina]|nr:developmental pluripotency-associated 5 protein-like [Mirounga leonina]
MGTLPERKDIPPWVKAPEDLKDPEVLQVQTQLLEAMFGPAGSRIPYIEQVSKVMLELKVLESSDLMEIVAYGSYLYKLRARWMLQSMAEWHLQRQE